MTLDWPTALRDGREFMACRYWRTAKEAEARHVLEPRTAYFRSLYFDGRHRRATDDERSRGIPVGWIGRWPTS